MGKEYKLLSRERKNSSLSYNVIYLQPIFGVIFMVDDIQLVLKCFRQDLATLVKLPAVHHQVGICIPTIILQKSVPDAQH